MVLAEEGATDYLRARVPPEALERMLAEERAADQDSDLPLAVFAGLSYANRGLLKALQMRD